MELFPVPHEIMSHSKSITVEETLHREASRSGARAGLDIFMPTNREVCHVSCVCIILYLWTYQLKSGSYLVIFGNICAAAAVSGAYLECLEGLHDCGWRLVAPLLLLLPLHTSMRPLDPYCHESSRL